MKDFLVFMKVDWLNWELEIIWESRASGIWGGISVSNQGSLWRENAGAHPKTVLDKVKLDHNFGDVGNLQYIQSCL